MDTFEEKLYLGAGGQGYAQRFAVRSVLFEEKTEHQHLIIFDNPYFGRVLALDGIVQTTEKDEFIYHEMMAHPPLLAHGAPRRVLIIGGGDGGVLREVLKHDGVEEAVLVEIDRRVIDLSLEYLPSLSDGAYDDPRAKVVITDGVKYVADGGDPFDVIIVDSTDPIGPGEALFTERFYASCAGRLSGGGILVAQNGVPFFQGEEVRITHKRLSPSFSDVWFYLAAVPTYVGGFMTLAWASQNADLRGLTVSALQERIDAAGLSTRYYNAGVHAAAFCLPNYVRKLFLTSD